MIYVRLVLGIVLLSLSVSTDNINIEYVPPVPKVEDSPELVCITKAAYFEARGESEKGIRMVMDVIINRTKDKRFPNTICDVIKQPNAFSFYTPRSIKRKIPSWHYRHIKKIALRSLQDGYKSLLPSGVVFYKRCDHQGEGSRFFNNRKMYIRESNHCFYY